MKSYRILSDWLLVLLNLLLTNNFQTMRAWGSIGSTNHFHPFLFGHFKQTYKCLNILVFLKLILGIKMNKEISSRQHRTMDDSFIRCLPLDRSSLWHLHTACTMVPSVLSEKLMWCEHHSASLLVFYVSQPDNLPLHEICLATNFITDQLKHKQPWTTPV